MSIIQNYINFLKSSGETTPNFERSSGNFFRIFFPSAIISVVLVIVSSIVSNFLGLDPSEHAIVELMENADPITIFFLIVLIGPLIEELAFRMMLGRSRASLALGLPAVSLFILDLVLGFSAKFSSKIDYLISSEFFQTTSLVLYFVVYISTAAMIYLNFKNTENFYKKHFKKIFWFLLLSFGLMHALNYGDSLKIFAFAIFLSAPQIYLSTVLAFVRINYNFITGYIYHLLHNFSYFFPVFLITLFTPELMKQEELSETLMQNMTNLQTAIILFATIWYLSLFILGLYFSLLNILEYKKASKNEASL